MQITEREERLRYSSSEGGSFDEASANMDQQSVYNLLDFSNGTFEAPFAGLPTVTKPVSNANIVLQGFKAPLGNCPASTALSIGQPGTEQCWNGGNPQLWDYVGIMGAYPDPAGRTNVSSISPNYDAGQYTNTGLLGVAKPTRIRDAIDGTSNTMLVGEQSGLVSGVDIRSNYYGGWSGFSGVATGGNTLSNAPPPWTQFGAQYDVWSSGVTTVRYNPNVKVAGPGALHSYEPNTILNSFHAGGINALIGDGSVRFIGDSINFGTLARVASMNDGLVVGEY